MSLSGNLATEERLTWLVTQLEKKGTVGVSDAADTLSVSEMTIRRDLLNLEGLGLARRVRGGAVAIGPVSFEGRHRTHARSKEKIAAKLQPLVPATGAIGMDASSTVLRLSGLIAHARDLAIITNGQSTFAALQDKPGLTPILTGGRLEAHTGSLVGPFACRTAGNLLLSRLFISAAALDSVTGSSEATIDDAEVKRAFVATSTEVVLAVDSTKLDSRSIAPAVDWTQISLLVTELDPKDSRLIPYRDQVEIL